MSINKNDLMSKQDFEHNKQILRRFQQTWEETNHGTTGVCDAAIRKYIEGHPQNCDLHQVLTKCILINRVYSTRISAENLVKIAKHIVEQLNFDELLKRGDLSTVEIIRTTKGANRNFAFATKFCALHKNEYYPIFDGLSVETLWKYQDEINFTDGINEKSAENLHSNLRNDGDYQRYIKIYDDFIRTFGLGDYNYRQVDKYLWTVSKPEYEESK